MIARCFDPERPVVVVDDAEMARRIQHLNPDVDVRVNSIMIQADPQPPPRFLQAPRVKPNRHERRRQAALARCTRGT